MIINVTDHDLNFWTPATGNTYIVSPSGIVINAGKRQIVQQGPGNVTYIVTQYIPLPKDLEAVRLLRKQNPDAVIVGSIIAAKAYPEFVVSPLDGPDASHRNHKYQARDDRFEKQSALGETYGQP